MCFVWAPHTIRAEVTMAKIIFSLEELVTLLVSNEILPSAVTGVETDGEKISFVIKIDSFFLPAIPASLRYVGFEEGNAVFEFTLVNSHFNKAIGGLGQTLESKIPPGIKLDLPNVRVDVNRLLEEKKVRGIEVRDIIFENGSFTIETGSV